MDMKTTLVGLLLLGLAFFAVGVDMIAIEEPWLLGKALGALEDGGEQIVMSVIVCFVLALTLGRRPLHGEPRAAAAQRAPDRRRPVAPVSRRRATSRRIPPGDEDQDVPAERIVKVTG